MPLNRLRWEEHHAANQFWNGRTLSSRILLSWNIHFTRLLAIATAWYNTISVTHIIMHSIGLTSKAAGLE